MKSKAFNLSANLKKVKLSIHSFRQFLGILAVSFMSLSAGATFGHSAVLIPQLKKDKSLVYDAQYDSWIASIITLAMATGTVFTGPLVDRYGRRTGLIFCILPFVIGYVIQSVASSITLILIGRFFAGISTGAYRPISFIYLGEITDPKNRDTAFVSISITFNLGVLLSHAVGHDVYWKLIVVIFCIPVLLSFLLLLFLKESPLWVISNGNSERGSEIFQWYREKTDAAAKELETAIIRQDTEKWRLKDIFSKPFFKGLAIATVLLADSQFSGVNTINFYAEDLLTYTFGDKLNPFYIMIFIDLIRLVSSIAVIVIVKYVSRRSLTLSASFATAIALFGLIAYTALGASDLIYLGLTSMIIYIAVSSAIVTLGWSFYSELYNVKVRGIGTAVSTSIGNLLLFSAVKLSPSIIDSYGIATLYATNSAFVLICSVTLCFVLPDTSGKCLQDIQDGLNNKQSIESGNSTRSKENDES